MTKIAFFYFIAELFMTVSIGFAICWLNNPGAILAIADVRIVARVDVDSQTSGMIGELVAAGYLAITETAGVVVAHLAFVIGIIFIRQTHLLNRVVVGI